MKKSILIKNWEVIFKIGSAAKDKNDVFWFNFIPYCFISCSIYEPECNSLNRFHPTQKPTDLMRYLILTYSNKGETVFDGYSGSGTTAESCIIEQRNFIGSELNKEYFDKSVLRLKNVPQSLF
jgi:DNA modification methylase